MNSRLYPLARIHKWDLAVCVSCNRASRHRLIGSALRLVSRLGDGLIWYILIGALAICKVPGGPRAALHMVLTGLGCTALHKWLKVKTLRPRPCHINPIITLGALPLDQFSFPSGHTLHAVAFTMLAVWYFPTLIWLLAPLTLLIALSRVVLGLHYPSDVLAGAAIGASISTLSIQLSMVL